MTTPSPLYAWHFVGATLRDGRPIPADGVPLDHAGRLVLRESGLHASRDAFDALYYAPGDTLCLVRCGGDVIEADDKLVCTRRTIIARMDATPLLRYYTRMQALSVVDNYPGQPDQVVLDWLMTGDESLRSAAWSATRSAAWSASRSAARSAAYSAADSAARLAARSAAYAAEYAVAAAYSAADTAALSTAYAAASTAACSATYSAARSAARAEFNALVRDAFADWLP